MAVTQVHMYWHQGAANVPPCIAQCIAAWTARRDARVTVWGHQSVVEHILPRTVNDGRLLWAGVEKLNLRAPGIYAAYSDIARVLILSLLGGVYVDTDAWPTSSTDWLLGVAHETSPSVSVTAFEEGSGLISNAVLAVPPRARPAMAQIMQHMLDDEESMRSCDVCTAIHANGHSKSNWDVSGHSTPNWDVSALPEEARRVLRHTGPIIFTAAMQRLPPSLFTVMPKLWMHTPPNDSTAEEYITPNTSTCQCRAGLGVVQHCFAGSWF